ITCVVAVAVLLVSSASKIALLGSTVTTLVIVPTALGATSVRVIVVVDSGPSVPPVQVTTLNASTAQPPENAGPVKLSKMRPAISGSRTVARDTPLMPLLPTTNV